MDVLGDYLYIIIVLGIVVINIFKNLKKQKPVTIPDFSGNHPESKENDDEDFWGNPLPPPPPRQEPPKIQQVQNKPKSVETPSYKDDVNRQQVSRLKEPEEDKNISVAFSDSDDARRAFIYSEIWNRRY